MQLPATLVPAIFAKAAKSNYFDAMNLISLQSLFAYWSGAEMGANLTVIMNLIGAMLLGLLVGY